MEQISHPLTDGLHASAQKEFERSPYQWAGLVPIWIAMMLNLFINNSAHADGWQLADILLRVFFIGMLGIVYPVLIGYNFYRTRKSRELLRQPAPSSYIYRAMIYTAAHKSQKKPMSIWAVLLACVIGLTAGLIPAAMIGYGLVIWDLSMIDTVIAFMTIAIVVGGALSLIGAVIMFARNRRRTDAWDQERYGAWN